jgi:hypothetical protein
MLPGLVAADPVSTGEVRPLSSIRPTGLTWLILFTAVLLHAGHGSSIARTWTVASGAGATIQSAIDAAADGDTLDIGGGVFNERFTVRNKSLLIRGQGMESTVINAFPNSGNYGHAVSLLGRNNYTEIRDLTISYGFAYVTSDPYNGNYGGGVYGEGALFALVRCRITECRSLSLGGGIYCTLRELPRAGGQEPEPRTGPPRPEWDRDAILIQECRIDANAASSEGGGIYAEFATLRMKDCLIENNFTVHGGGGALFYADGELTGNVFLRNRSEFYGGALSIQHFTTLDLLVGGNTFVYNEAGRDGAGVMVMAGVTVRLERNLFAFQRGEGGGHAVACMEPDGEYTGECNHFWANGSDDLPNCMPLPTDTRGDPLFCGAPSGDFRLCVLSPAYVGPCPPRGARGAGCEGEGCATAARSVTWGAIKALHR